MSVNLVDYLRNLDSVKDDVESQALMSLYGQLPTDLENLEFSSAKDLTDMNSPEFEAVHEQLLVLPNDPSHIQLRHIETIVKLFEQEYLSACEQKAIGYAANVGRKISLLDKRISDIFRDKVEFLIYRVLSHDPEFLHYTKDYSLNGVTHTHSVTITHRVWLIRGQGHLSVYPTAALCVWDSVGDDPETMKLICIPEVVTP